MKTKIMTLLLITLCLCSLTGCNTVILENECYKIAQSNGKRYLYFSEMPSFDNSNSSHASVNKPISYPTSATIQEMIQKIETGSFTEDELLGLQYSASLNNGKLEIPKWYELEIPRDLSLSYIHWSGNTYSYHIRGLVRGYVKFLDKSRYNAAFEDEYANFFENESIEVISHQTDSDRNADVYYYQTSTGRYKVIRYVIEAEGKTIYVSETYDLERYCDPNEIVSETVPHSIDFYGTDGTTYFEGWFIDFKERPTVEWLSQFGMKEYVEAEIS